MTTHAATISIQSTTYQLPGIVAATVWEHSQANDWIEVTTPGGRTDEYLKSTWEIDPT